MAVTSPDNLWSPDSTDAYNLTVDLAAMQDSVQDALDGIRDDNGTWVQVTSFLNGYSAAIPVYYRVHRGRVDLSGQLWRGTAPQGESAFTLPAAAFPRNSLTIATTMFTSGTQPTWVSCNTVGGVSVWSQAIRTSGVGFQLDGVGWGI